MSVLKFRHVALMALILAMVSATTAQAAFTNFVIREGGGSAPDILTNNDYVPGATEFVIAQGGQKAAAGSSDLDGYTIGDIMQLKIVRHDAKLPAGSGPAVAPYFNIWITDGADKYAVIANEPSNPDFSSLYNNGYDLSWGDIAGKVAKAYENADLSWLPNGGVNMTFAQLAGYTIKAPTVGELTTGWAGLGTGAPRELGSNAAYGFNWVFGDTLANYVSGDEGYVVSGAVVQAIPEPASLALVGAAALGLFVVRRRQRSNA